MVDVPAQVNNLLIYSGDTGKCGSASTKAAGKAGSGVFGCWVKEPITEGGCAMRIYGKLSSALVKAGNCADWPALVSRLDTCVTGIDAIVNPPPTSTTTTSTSSTTSTTLPGCCDAGSYCAANYDPGTCSSLGGIPGPAGSECDAVTGNCVVTSGLGNCCAAAGTCFTGPGADPTFCSNAGYQYLANAHCTLANTCEVPCQAGVGGFCWYLGADGANCNDTCAAAGGCTTRRPNRTLAAGGATSTATSSLGSSEWRASAATSRSAGTAAWSTLAWEHCGTPLPPTRRWAPVASGARAHANERGLGSLPPTRHQNLASALRPNVRGSPEVVK